MKTAKRVAGGVLALLLVIAALTYFTGLDQEGFIDALSRASPTVVLLSSLVYVTGWPLRGLRYRWILRSMNHDEPLGLLTGAVFLSQSANLALPARAGDGLRAAIVKRRGVPLTTGVASLAVERLGDLVAVAALGAVGLVAALYLGVPTPEPPTEFQFNTYLLLIPLGVIAAFLVARRAGLLEGLLADLRRGVSLSSTPSVLGSSGLIWLIDAATAVVVLYAFGVNPTPDALASILVAVSAANLSKTLPLTPGGVGAYEAVFAAVLAAAGVGWGVAVAAAVVDHLVKNLVTLAGGMAASAWLGVDFLKADIDPRDADRRDGTGNPGDGRKEDLSG